MGLLQVRLNLAALLSVICAVTMSENVLECSAISVVWFGVCQSIVGTAQNCTNSGILLDGSI